MNDKINKIETSNLFSKQLQYEYIAYHSYNSISAYFRNCKNEYIGLSKAFKKMANEELSHADGLIEFMNKRDLEISFLKIEIADIKDKTALELVNLCIDLEEEVSDHLNVMYKYANTADDFVTTVFLDPYLEEQIDSIKELNWYKKSLECCNDKFKIVWFDNEVYSRMRKSKD